MNSRAKVSLNYFYFCNKNKEVCGKNLGRMECSLWAIPVAYRQTQDCKCATVGACFTSWQAQQDFTTI